MGYWVDKFLNDVMEGLKSNNTMGRGSTTNFGKKGVFVYNQ